MQIAKVALGIVAGASLTAASILTATASPLNDGRYADKTTTPHGVSFTAANLTTWQAGPATDVTATPTVTDTAPALSLSATSALAGDPLTVTASGLPAQIGAEIWVGSTPIKVWSEKTTAQGTVTQTVTIPTSTTLGIHPLELRLADGTSLSADLTIANGTPAPDTVLPNVADLSAPAAPTASSIADAPAPNMAASSADESPATANIAPIGLAVGAAFLLSIAAGLIIMLRRRTR